jgi:hypothetical protein
MRFCSRCGFPLGGVRELIESGGTLAESKARPSPVVKGMRRGVWLILIGLFLGLIATVITAADDDFAPIFIIPVLCIVIGFIRLLYSTFIQERWQRGKVSGQDLNKQAEVISQPRASLSLPAGAPLGFEAPKRNTREMASPPSVTENTTRLLEDDGTESG